MNRHILTIIVVIGAFCMFFSVGASISAESRYEKPSQYDANTLLKPEALHGKFHTVAETVQHDGFFYHFTVNSDFGDYTAVSIPSLISLLHELSAIAAMKKVESSDTAVDSLQKSGKKTVEGVKNLFTDPEGTFTGASQGVSSLFHRTKATIGSRKLTEAEDSRMEQLIGLTKSKGEIANTFGVSIYSRNQVLQEELDRLAMADYLGGISVGIATSAVSGVGGVVLSTSGTARLLNETINVTSPAELWLQNEKKLLAMGMQQDTVELFLNNPVFTPAQHTIIAATLEKLDGAENRELFIKVGLQASTPEMAGVITDLAVMAAAYDKHIARLTGLSPMARLLHGMKKDGTVVVLLPTDHLILTERIEQVAEYISHKNADTKKRSLEIWTLGSISDAARSSFLSNGWQVHEQAYALLFPPASQEWPIQLKQ